MDRHGLETLERYLSEITHLAQSGQASHDAIKQHESLCGIAWRAREAHGVAWALLKGAMRREIASRAPAPRKGA